LAAARYNVPDLGDAAMTEKKTAADLVAYARAQLGKRYWYGTFGQKPTETLLQQKIKQYPYSKKLTSYRSDRVAAHRTHMKDCDQVHDCIGLIKGVIFCDHIGSGRYRYNPKLYDPKRDKSANGLRALCAKNGGLGAISSMPDIPGLLLFYDGHVGVYIGNGQVVEARGTDYGVVQTALKSRLWTSWGLCPWIEYETTTTPKQPVELPKDPPMEYIVQRGDSWRRIAKQQLGSEQEFERLAHHNGMAVTDTIHPGMKLKIPAKKAEGWV
jgi:nucleoid-associated protein YgaU